MYAAVYIHRGHSGSGDLQCPWHRWYPSFGLMLHFLSNWFSQNRISMLTFGHQGAPIVLHKKQHKHAQSVFVLVDDGCYILLIMNIYEPIWLNRSLL